VCLHISQVWIRVTLLYSSPLVNDVAEHQTNQFSKTRAFMEIYALFSLSRLIWMPLVNSALFNWQKMS
jgi:hypothetical protein